MADYRILFLLIVRLFLASATPQIQTCQDVECGLTEVCVYRHSRCESETCPLVPFCFSLRGWLVRCPRNCDNGCVIDGIRGTCRTDCPGGHRAEEAGHLDGMTHRRNLPDASTKKGYIGCFKDRNSDLVGYVQKRIPALTPQLCMAICKKKEFKYAGVQYYDECFCGNTYGSLGEADENDCNTPCKGDSTQMCGGPHRNSIYRTGPQAKMPTESDGCQEYPCLIFEDNFDDLNMEVWEHEITANGGGNGEFQYYLNNRSNSYVRDGKLYIKPTLTADRFSEDFIESGVLDLKGMVANDVCTGGFNYGCERSGNRAQQRIINPIQSARLRSVRGFNMKYGKLEIVAKIPTGDWIWPAIWMLPRWLRYGGWPASGEIDIMESRGNVDMTDNHGNHIGNNHVGSTLHYGPDPAHNGFPHTTGQKVRSEGTYADKFFTYVLEWTPEGIKTTVDGEEIFNVSPGSGGFWSRGGFSDNLENPWRNAHSTMAPFDQEFYLIFNVAVGGTAYFPEVTGKPWLNTSPHAAWDFWSARDQWYPTWKPDADSGEGAALVIDSVRYWKLQE